MVHPQCRGYIHKLRFIPLSSKPQFICALSCRFLLPLDSRAHSSRLLRTQLQTFLTFLQNPLRTQLQRSSTHIAGTCSFLTKSNLTSPYLSYIKKNLTSPFSISAYLYCAFFQNHGLKPWAPKTLNPGFQPRVYYKKGVLTSLDTPNTALTPNSAYKLYH